MATLRARPPDVVSQVMRRVHSRDTSPEVSLRRALWKRGLRYRLYSRRLPGQPDIIFPSAKLAVFVDGDFWHGNQWRLRRLSSLEDQFRDSASAGYWIPKIRRNMERDARANEELAGMSWLVIRIWESELRENVDACADRVADAVARKRGHGATHLS